jgi:hypothetical protein
LLNDLLLNDLYYNLKTLARPILRRRRLVERVRYFGTRILSSQEGNDWLAASLGRPCAAGKIGGSENAALRHFMRRAGVDGETISCQGSAFRNLHRLSGVFPPEPAIFSRFCQSYTAALASVDALAVWFNLGERAACRRFASRADLMELEGLEPYYHDRPWSRGLAGLRVLVLSPFAKSIERQYQCRKKIWRLKPDVLPDFELRTIRVPLYSCIAPAPYENWFVALDALRDQMSAAPFDAAIVGAGAWSIPLVAHAKSLGCWAIHLGGVTQILFGIKGRRWEGNKRIAAFFNESWVRPAPDETPQGINTIENGCYW